MKHGESHPFHQIPMPVPPMIEDAFRYRGREQYVSLGFGVDGGRMSDGVGDGKPPSSPDLYASFLRHPAIQPYTQAFKIDTVPPSWLEGLPIDEADLYRDQFEAWSNRARCLLLDRQSRQFFVGTVNQVRMWLNIRPALCRNRARCEPSPSSGHKIAKIAERALWAWLDSQHSPQLPVGFVETWERRFREDLAISGCLGAGVKLGFDAEAVEEMLMEAFGNRKDET